MAVARRRCEQRKVEGLCPHFRNVLLPNDGEKVAWRHSCETGLREVMVSYNTIFLEIYGMFEFE